MRKNTLIVSLSLLSVIICIGAIAWASSAKPESKDILEQANELRHAQKYSEAEKLYNQVKAENPGSDKALEAQKQIVFIDIAQKNQEKADTDFQRFITEFTGNKNLADAVYRIGVEYRLTAKNMDKSLELHKLNVENHPDSMYGLWSQVEIARTYVRQGNELADEETDKMVNLFANQPTLPKEIYTLAIAYAENKKEEQALKLYQYDMQKYPDNLYSALSKVKYHNLKKDYDSADAAVSSLIAAFSDQEEAKKCLRDTASFYRSQKEYKRAIPLYQYQIEHKSIFGEPVDAFRNLAFTYIDMNDTEAGTSVINKMQADLSESKQLARATYDIARYYKDKGDIENALRIHEFNVDNNTKSTESMWSQTEITYHYIRSGDILNAETAYQKLLTTFKDQKTLPKEVFQVGDAYRKVKQYDKALSLYKYQLEKWPNYGEPVDIYRKMACTYIDMKDIENADVVIAQMQEKFAKNTRLARMNFDIGNYFLNDANDPANALKVHKYNADNYTNVMESMWSQAAIVWYHVRHNENDKADEVYAKLLSTFKDQKTLAKEVFQIADIYTEVGNTKKARELHNQVLKDWPESEYTLNASTGLIKADMADGKDVEVMAGIDQFIKDYNDRSNLSDTVFLLGEEYWNQANKEFQKANPIFQGRNSVRNEIMKNKLLQAKAVWEKIISQLPESNLAPQAYKFAAMCYEGMDEREKAIEYYKTVVENWPGYVDADYCLYMIGRIYRSLDQLGIKSASETEPLMEKAYRNIVVNYPDSTYSKSAQQWLTSFENRKKPPRTFEEKKASFMAYQESKRQGGQK